MPRLTAPRGALLRVFHNLISNSLKHGGRADLHIKVRWQDLGDHPEFTLSDNGVGIDPQLQAKEHLFPSPGQSISRLRIYKCFAAEMVSSFKAFPSNCMIASEPSGNSSAIIALANGVSTFLWRNLFRGRAP